MDNYKQKYLKYKKKYLELKNSDNYQSGGFKIPSWMKRNKTQNETHKQHETHKQPMQQTETHKQHETHKQPMQQTETHKQPMQQTEFNIQPKAQNVDTIKLLKLINKEITLREFINFLMEKNNNIVVRDTKNNNFDLDIPLGIKRDLTEKFNSAINNNYNNKNVKEFLTLLNKIYNIDINITENVETIELKCRYVPELTEDCVSEVNHNVYFINGNQIYMLDKQFFFYKRSNCNIEHLKKHSDSQISLNGSRMNNIDIDIDELDLVNDIYYKIDKLFYKINDQLHKDI